MIGRGRRPWLRQTLTETHLPGYHHFDALEAALGFLGDEGGANTADYFVVGHKTRRSGNWVIIDATGSATFRNPSKDSLVDMEVVERVPTGRTIQRDNAFEKEMTDKRVEFTMHPGEEHIITAVDRPKMVRAVKIVAVKDWEDAVKRAEERRAAAEEPPAVATEVVPVAKPNYTGLAIGVVGVAALGLLAWVVFRGRG